jgi:hypothetical protein
MERPPPAVAKADGGPFALARRSAANAGSEAMRNPTALQSRISLALHPGYVRAWFRQVSGVVTLSLEVLLHRKARKPLNLGDDFSPESLCMIIFLEL